MIDLSDLINKRGLIDKAIQGKVQEVKTKIAMDVHRGVVLGSPVETGAFRGAWQVEVPEEPFQSAEVTNNTPYGPFLLDGHSQQAPQGWVDNVVESAAHLGGKR